jgi:hypothetical protein
MTSNLETTVAATSKSKRAATRTAARQAEATLKPAPAPAPTPPARQHVKTILVPSCGWPTDATVPPRRRTAKR